MKFVIFSIVEGTQNYHPLTTNINQNSASVSTDRVSSTAGARPQQVKFTLPRHLFTHLGFPSVRVVLNITFIPGFVMIMD